METTVSQIFLAKQPPYVSAYICNLAIGNDDQPPVVLMNYDIPGDVIFYVFQ